MRIRVFLLEDHHLVRAGLRLILSDEADLDVIGEAADGQEGLELIRALQPDVVLCDLHLPTLDGQEVTQQLMAEPGGPKILIVSMMEDGALLRRAIAAGAHGYVPKACPARELLHAVRAMVRGQRYISARVARGLLTDPTPFDRLSRREFEVALALARGDQIRAIAWCLDISASTVRTLKGRALEKTGARHAGELAAMAVEYGLLEPGHWSGANGAG